MSSPKKPSEKTQKIKIPDTKKAKDETEKLLEKAKIVSEKTEEKPKKRRGRPPKRKKPRTYDAEKYKDSLIAKMTNNALIWVGNKSLEPLPDSEKLTEKDCEIGEAVCYLMDYYGVTLDHPLMIVFFAVTGYVWALGRKQVMLKKLQKVKELEGKPS